MVEDRDLAAAHRQFGAGLFNHTWTLIDKGGTRDADDDVEMLLAAMTSRWHWGRCGGPEQVITGDWQVSHVLAALGQPSLSLLFARRALDGALAAGCTGWRLASVHEGMARALAAAGDASGRAGHVAEAQAALAGEPDDDNRAEIARQLAGVPEA